MNIPVTPPVLSEPAKHQERSRNLGLDVLRSTAILMVIVSHSRYFFSLYDLQALSIFGLLGVELFFVLSGFLIGRMIITEVMEKPSFTSLRRFFLRRWFRTLPLYYLVFAFLIIVVGKPFYWQGLFFLHNLDSVQLNVFAVSWSLSIEEWFYLLTPLALMLLAIWRNRYKQQIFWFYCGLVLIVSISARLVITLNSNPEWDFGIRKQIFLRQDSLIIGVALAGFKIYYPILYKRLSAKANWLLTLGVLGLVGIGFYYIVVLKSGNSAIDSSVFARVGMFPLISVSVAFLLFGLEQNQFLKNFYKVNFFSRLIVFISQISYALYITHYDIFAFFRDNNNQPNSLSHTFLILGGAFIVTFVVVVLLHYFFEQPIMNLRSKFKVSR